MASKESEKGPLAAEITALLKRMSQGDSEARDTVWALLLEEMQRAANRIMRNQGPGATLQATQLVGFAWERMAKLAGQEWKDRRHFVRYAAMAMRSALVDHVRKRKEDDAPVPLDDVAAEVGARVDGDLVAFNDALRQFEAVDAVMAQALWLRAMGYSIDEIAEQVEMPRRTLDRKLARARAYLFRLMQ